MQQIMRVTLQTKYELSPHKINTNQSFSIQGSITFTSKQMRDIFLPFPRLQYSRQDIRLVYACLLTFNFLIHQQILI